jgi:signal transduction histidine kinase/CheY-like chemotaxis protein
MAVSGYMRTRDDLRFESAVQELRASLQTRVETQIALLRAGAAMLASTPSVGRHEFHEFVEHLSLPKRFPGVQGIGYSRRFPASELTSIEQELQRQGVGKFRVRPLEPPRDVYHAILYLEPVDERNLAALGYDMFTEPRRRAAMERAQDTAAPAASGRVHLVQEIVLEPHKRQAGFLIYLPVYRNNVTPRTMAERRRALDGFVYSPFRAGDFLATLMSAERRRSLVLQVYDGTKIDASALLYDSDTRRAVPSGGWRAVLEENVAGRPWTLVVSGQPAFAAAWPGLVNAILAFGVGTSVLLFMLTRAEGRARAQAEKTAAALRVSQEELQVASHAKDDFLATLSHELRTPLNAILGWARLLRMGHLDERRREDALAIIERNARAQVSLVEDLLDVSRIVTGTLRLDMRVVAINPILEQAVNTVRPTAESKGVRLEWTPDPLAGAIFAAPDRVQQVVWNLLSNAIKFTPEGGCVLLRTERFARELRLIVGDDGVGVDPSFLPHMFERFRQADSTTTRAHSGMGLGLAIVRHLVELHGGTVTAVSDGPGKGATFTVVFPLRRAVRAVGHTGADAQELRPAEHHPPNPTGQLLAGVRVLVVDDEPDACELVSMALSSQGAHVCTAGSVSAAVRVLETEPVDLVVSDIAMPGEDGYALLRRLRSPGSSRFSTLPVIALTAHTRAEDRDAALARGFQGFLAKPVELDELTTMVAHLAGLPKTDDRGLKTDDDPRHSVL